MMRKESNKGDQNKSPLDLGSNSCKSVVDVQHLTYACLYILDRKSVV